VSEDTHFGDCEDTHFGLDMTLTSAMILRR
jgi:hypothetical protein